MINQSYACRNEYWVLCDIVWLCGHVRWFSNLSRFCLMCHVPELCAVRCIQEFTFTRRRVFHFDRIIATSRSPVTLMILPTMQVILSSCRAFHSELFQTRPHRWFEKIRVKAALWVKESLVGKVTIVFPCFYFTLRSKVSLNCKMRFLSSRC